MRVCPKCGHHDPWYWQGSFIVGLEFCRLEDFKGDYSDLAGKLTKAKEQHGTKNFVFDKDYCYHLTKSGKVERQSIIENPSTVAGHWRIPQESSPAKERASFGRNPAYHGKKLGKIAPWKMKGQKQLTEISSIGRKRKDE